MNRLSVTFFLLTNQLIFGIINNGVQANKDYFIEPFMGIINGHKVPEGKYPFMAALIDKQTQQVFCGGSILNAFTILTAAHCVVIGETNGIYPKDVQIMIGQTDRRIKSPENLFDMKSWTHHKDFVLENVPGGMDIAIAVLTRPIDFGKLKYASEVTIPGPNVQPVFADCIVMGWGEQTFGIINSEPNVLKETNVRLRTVNDCRKYAYSYNSKSLLCAGSKSTFGQSNDACQGDSGGPLVCPIKYNEKKLAQFGIVSFGKGCGKEPGFYTKVSSFKNWILETVKNETSLTAINYYDFVY